MEQLTTSTSKELAAVVETPQYPVVVSHQGIAIDLRTPPSAEPAVTKDPRLSVLNNRGIKRAKELYSEHFPVINWLGNIAFLSVGLATVDAKVYDMSDGPFFGFSVLTGIIAGIKYQKDKRKQQKQQKEKQFEFSRSVNESTHQPDLFTLAETDDEIVAIPNTALRVALPGGELPASAEVLDLLGIQLDVPLTQEQKETLYPVQSRVCELKSDLEDAILLDARNLLHGGYNYTHSEAKAVSEEQARYKHRGLITALEEVTTEYTQLMQHIIVENVTNGTDIFIDISPSKTLEKILQQIGDQNKDEVILAMLTELVQIQDTLRRIGILNKTLNSLDEISKKVHAEKVAELKDRIKHYTLEVLRLLLTCAQTAQAHLGKSLQQVLNEN